jgi:hypothetical protein
VVFPYYYNISIYFSFLILTLWFKEEEKMTIIKGVSIQNLVNSYRFFFQYTHFILKNFLITLVEISHFCLIHIIFFRTHAIFAKDFY